MQVNSFFVANRVFGREILKQSFRVFGRVRGKRKYKVPACAHDTLYIQFPLAAIRRPAISKSVLISPLGGP